MRVISSSPGNRGASSYAASRQAGRSARASQPGALTALRGAAVRSVRLKWPYRPSALDAGWVAFSAVNLAAIYLLAGWETVPFHFIWISFTLVYGFRTWPTRPTMWVLVAVMATTGAGIGMDVLRGSEPVAELTEVPLMAAMFIAMVWHALRKQAAEESSRRISEENARLLATQQQFLQDAAHQLRTPITIALGHAELLASELTEPQGGQDVQVVIGELNRLRRIAERLLLIAAASDPAFLHREPVALDRLIMELIRRWLPTANRRWQVGRVDSVTVRADRERLGLALDALLENAVRHTEPGDVIELSVIRGWPGTPVRIVVADSGSGISPDKLPLIFDRFHTGDASQVRGTGLGLPLVRAVARAHGGDVIVRSAPGTGSQFELSLPPMASGLLALPAVSVDPASTGGPDGGAREAALGSE